jgi:NADPH-dependent curcumin reductase CurA
MVTFNRRLVLASRPVGIPTPAHFRRDDIPVGDLAVGQFLVRNLFLSIDPAQRGWVNASANYSEPVAIGAVMRSLAVGIIETSRHEQYKAGEHVYGWFGWQDFCVATETMVWMKVDPARGPVSTALGVFGINGLTAYLALTDIGAPKKGETAMVTTAAGGVGSLVGQFARRLGCHVVGLTGSAEKVTSCVTEYGYHSAMNYKAGLDADRLRALCPKGIDVFFDNTSGAIADAVWPLLNTHARVVQCGTAAIASWDPPPQALRRDRDVLMKRLRYQGFVIFDHSARYAEVVAQLASWAQQGALVYREDIEVGLDRAPAALAALYQGENHGKKIIQL